MIVSEDALAISGRREGRLLKLHGDFSHPDRMVITEHDYDVYLERNPVFATHLANLFITETMLLIGYSLEDSDFRSVWQVVNSRLGRMTRQAYAIEVDAPQAKIERFKRRNVHVINLPKHPDEYKESLRRFLSELKEYVDAERDKAASSTNEAVNEQMVIPAEHNMLCFISCSMRRIARLRALIYPALLEVEVIPVRIDDMIVPGANWVDIAETTLRKSRFVIVDLSDSSQNVATEAGVAIAMKKDVLFILEAGSAIPPYALNRQILTYTFEPSESNYQFLRSLQEWVMKASDRTGGDEPSSIKPLGSA